MNNTMKQKRIMASVAAFLLLIAANAEDGSDLWLRMQHETNTAKVETNDKSATGKTAVNELTAFWKGGDVTLKKDGKMPDNDGFSISKSAKDGSIVVKARRSAGLLYGAYELLRMQQTGNISLKETSTPAFEYRILNHWDNPDGSVERGYAGKSIWKWDEIDGNEGTMSLDLKERLTTYARANASIGINGIVINNVNASPSILSLEYIKKVKVIAGLLRPYGIKTYVSVNFASPMVLDGLETADPLNDKVRAWWKKKAKEIYKEIPDFGGFLVKANSEGQPGPATTTARTPTEPTCWPRRLRRTRE